MKSPALTLMTLYENDAIVSAFNIHHIERIDYVRQTATLTSGYKYGFANNESWNEFIKLIESLTAVPCWICGNARCEEHKEVFD